MASFGDYGQAKRRRGPATRAPRVTPADKGTDFSGVKGSEAALKSAGGGYAAKKKPRVKGSSGRVYTTTGQINQTGNERAGQSFATFTRADRPGIIYHEYMVGGKPKVVGVKKNRNSIG